MTYIIRFSILITLLAYSLILSRAEQPDGKILPADTKGLPSYTYMNINNVSTVFRLNGIADIDRFETNSGFVYPFGTGKTAIFQSGILWGAKVDNELRVGGSAYRTGLQAGKILAPGSPEDPDLPKNRIYRVRPDFLIADLATQAIEEGNDTTIIRNQYATDWLEWPASEGAPYTDMNGDGEYDPTIDVPGIRDASQTIWFVCNDLNSTLTTNLYGSNPMGIEMQVTLWAFSMSGAIGNTIYKRYLLINRSNSTFDSMYVSQWSDPDVGLSTDDYVGFDTTLGLAYGYNSTASDPNYSPLPPPAVGFALLQGPIVPSPGDTAISNGQIINDFKNLSITASYYFSRGDNSVSDPVQGSYSLGTIPFYNFFQGKIGLTGELFTDPNTNAKTPFALAGNPNSGQGWIDGQILSSGDRRMGFACGPFIMAPGDTQDIVVAEMASGATSGIDRLSAINLLRFYSQIVKSHYNTLLPVDDKIAFPFSYFLNQNYPNPFNPETKISFVVPTESFVSLAIYDVLGRKIESLIQQNRQPGKYSVTWNAKGVPSGIYFYRLATGEFVETKKMVLMK